MSPAQREGEEERGEEAARGEEEAWAAVVDGWRRGPLCPRRVSGCAPASPSQMMLRPASYSTSLRDEASVCLSVFESCESSGTFSRNCS